MLDFIIKRILIMIPTFIIITIISFVIIELPPGDFLSTYVAELQQGGQYVDQAELESLRVRYGLDQPAPVRYWRWISGILLRGDFGYSFGWERPVSDLIWERMGLTLVVSVSSLLFSWIVAFPIGIYSAVKQHTFTDYAITFIGFLGLSIPNFMFALVLMFGSYMYLDLNVGGLFSPEFIRASWSWAKFVDMLQHLWIPMIVIGTAGTAGLIRIMRNNLLDELEKPYVKTARSKGLSYPKAILKYPVRIAFIPFLSTAGWLLPQMISGEAITAVVLSLPTTGPLLLRGLLDQDMYLAGSIILLTASLTLIGTLISDLLLALADPRIRYD